VASVATENSSGSINAFADCVEHVALIGLVWSPLDALVGVFLKSFYWCYGAYLTLRR
jgi:hypothetical protein